MSSARITTTFGLGSSPATDADAGHDRNAAADQHRPNASRREIDLLIGMSLRCGRRLDAVASESSLRDPRRSRLDCPRVADDISSSDGRSAVQ
jgi:hypothetical protein